MMTKPSITELDKNVDSRYTLVSMVAKRARMIGMERHYAEAESAVYNPKQKKSVSQAVDEIADGIVGYVRSEDIDSAKCYEMEKIAAVSKLENEQESEDNDNAQTVAASDTDGEQSMIDAALKMALKEEAKEDN